MQIARGVEGIKPGWVRVSLPWYASDEDIEFILSAVEFVADHGKDFVPAYHLSWNLVQGSILGFPVSGMRYGGLLTVVDEAQDLPPSSLEELRLAQERFRVGAGTTLDVIVAQANLARTRLLAPFDGVIAEINGERFEFVTPSPLGVATPPVVDIIDNACFYVTAPIDEVDAADIQVGMPARISMDAFRDEHFSGRVRRIADYVLDIEKQARTVDVEVVFDQAPEGKNLLAGYSADIEVILDVRQDVVRVPTEAVMDGRRVYVFLPEEGRLAVRSIRIGLSNWDWSEVLEGVSPEEWVIVNVDNPDLEDGAAPVRLEEAP